MRQNELEQVYARVDECRFCKAEGNALRHIHGHGAMEPRLMLVLVNPTYRNISSDKSYHGDRFPFIGVRHFWRVMADGGLIDAKTAEGLPVASGWTEKHTDAVRQELFDNKLFLTNVVKCCYPHSNYPAGEVIREHAAFLADEIRTVRPKRIVAFGGLVYKTLTGKTVKLSEYWSGKPETATENISGLDTDVIPCYFPVGRGKPKEAARILRTLV